jgi:hypothetical protein
MAMASICVCVTHCARRPLQPITSSPFAAGVAGTLVNLRARWPANLKRPPISDACHPFSPDEVTIGNAAGPIWIVIRVQRYSARLVPISLPRHRACACA